MGNRSIVLACEFLELCDRFVSLITSILDLPGKHSKEEKKM